MQNKIYIAYAPEYEGDVSNIVYAGVCKDTAKAKLYATSDTGFGKYVETWTSGKYTKTERI